MITESKEARLDNQTTLLDLAAGVISFSACLFSALFEGSSLIGALMIVASIALYGSYSKNYHTFFSIKSLMVLFWMGSIGLSLLRIHPNQTAWCIEAALSLGIALPAFLLGYSFSRMLKKNDSDKCSDVDEHLFYVGLTALSLAIVIAFALDCLYSREIPAFSSSQSSYAKFGMPYIHYITVACCLVPALLYCGSKFFKKPATHSKLTFILVVICSIIPLAIVSRQLCLLEAILLFLSWSLFGKNEKKITIGKIIILVMAALAAWLFLSILRNQSNSYLITVFNLPRDSNSAQVAAWNLYLYVAFNFDNFNYLVQNLSGHTYGVCTGYPLIVFTAGKGLIPDGFTSLENLTALPTYTTYPFVQPAYRDFGVPGVALYALAIGFFSNRIEKDAFNSDKPIISIAYYLVLYSLMICFFTSEFAQPVFWFYMFLLLLFDVFTRTKRSVRPLSIN